MVRAAERAGDPNELVAVRTAETGVSHARGSLGVSEAESLRTLAGAFVELAIQVLGDKKETKSSEEAKAA